MIISEILVSVPLPIPRPLTNQMVLVYSINQSVLELVKSEPLYCLYEVHIKIEMI